MSQTPSPETKRLFEEQAAIREAMLNLLHTWASIECRLATILHDIINDKTGEIAFAIYFTPSSMEVRFQIVDSAMKALFDETRYAAFYAAWARLLNSIQRSKNLRNAVAHGAIGTAFVNGKNHVRLLPPIFDFRRMKPKRKNQIPGFGSNELKQSIEQLAEKLKSLDLVSRWLAATHSGDDSTSQETLAELEARLQIFDPQQGGQTPLTPLAPPEPSQA